MKLSQEEKAVVAHYINSDPSIWGAIKEYWPMLAPIISLEIYGLFNSDIVASGMAFVSLSGFMFWFFNQSGKSGTHLKSALEKYENEISAID